MSLFMGVGTVLNGILLNMKGLRVNIVRGLLVMLSWLPLKFHYFMGDVLSWLARVVLKYRTDVVWVNISRSFPEKKYKDLKLIYKDFYRHFGEIVAETIWFSGSSYKKLRRQGIVSAVNPEVLAETYSNAPGVTLLCTHCGNWELLGGLLSYNADGSAFPFDEHDVKVVYKKQKNAVADEVFRRNREAPISFSGASCALESRDVLRYCLKHKDEKKVYIYPADQAPYKDAGKHPIGEFMHQQTNAMIGSMGVACKLSHAVVYMTMKRVGRGHYEITYIPICPDASALSPEVILRKYYDLLEEEINETPANWLWSHKRWK